MKFLRYLFLFLPTYVAEGAEGGGATLLGSQGAEGSGLEGTSGDPGSGSEGGTLAEPFWKNWITPEGKLNKDAYTKLPEDLKGLSTDLSKYENIESLIRSYAHVNTLVGKKGLQPLPDNAPENVREEFTKNLRNVLRVPETPEGYGIKRPESVPEEAWNEEYAGEMAKLFHKHAVPPSAVQEIVKKEAEFVTKLAAEAEAKQQVSIEQAQESLKKDFGIHYQRKLHSAAKAARTLGLDLNDPVVGNHPGVIKAMAQIADMIGEDKLISDGSGESGNSAAMELDKIYTDQTNPYYQAFRDPGHPLHSSARNRVEQLAKLVSMRQK